MRAMDAADGLLSTLNDAQREAVRHGDEPLLIVAGAGTGKTTTLAHRVAALIARGVPPRRILLLTFTRRAAKQMVDRVRDLVAREVPSVPAAEVRQIWGGTFHATAVRLLRAHGKQIGVDPNFGILDRGDAEDLMNALREELGLAKVRSEKNGGKGTGRKGRKSGERFPMKGTCVNIYSRTVNAQESLELTLKSHFEWCEEYVDGLKKLLTAYVARKKQHLTLDYDDLLLFWRTLMQSPAGEKIRGKFDHVLVDEYQDTNVLQSDILRGLRPDGRGLSVVGDDAQSIYSFRAATVRNILDFPDQFAGTRVVPLERNYRSTQSILDLSNAVIAEAKERHEKRLWTDRTGGILPRLIACENEDEQAEEIAETILERREEGVELKEQAVLFRASHHSLQLEVALSRLDIPFVKFGGLRFAEAAHVKDVLALLKMAENWRDAVSGIRVLSLLPGVGPATARKLLLRLEEANGDFVAWLRTKPPSAAADHWPSLCALLGSLAKNDADMATQLSRAVTFYEPLLRERHDNPVQRLLDLKQLEGSASRYTSRQEFLTDLTLDPPQRSTEVGDPLKDDDYLTLSTIHSAKGLEWRAVTLMHASDGNMPSDLATGSEAELEEERRLMYVALTRAKTHLDVTFPRTYYKPGGFHGLMAQPSRFLQGEAEDLMELVEAESAPVGVWGDAAALFR